VGALDESGGSHGNERVGFTNGVKLRLSLEGKWVLHSSGRVMNTYPNRPNKNYQLSRLPLFHHLLPSVPPIPRPVFLHISLRYRPYTAYNTLAITQIAITPVETPRPIDAGTLRPRSGSAVMEGSAVDEERVASDEDEKRVVCGLDDGSRGGVVTADVVGITEDDLSSPVLVVDVVVGAYIDEGTIVIGSGLVTMGKVSRSVGVVGVASMVVTIVVAIVVAGPIDMIIGGSPPVFVDADIVAEMACRCCDAWVVSWLCEGV